MDPVACLLTAQQPALLPRRSSTLTVTPPSQAVRLLIVRLESFVLSVRLYSFQCSNLRRSHRDPLHTMVGQKQRLMLISNQLLFFLIGEAEARPFCASAFFSSSSASPITTSFTVSYAASTCDHSTDGMSDALT